MRVATDSVTCKPHRLFVWCTLVLLSLCAYLISWYSLKFAATFIQDLREREELQQWIFFSVSMLYGGLVWMVMRWLHLPFYTTQKDLFKGMLMWLGTLPAIAIVTFIADSLVKHVFGEPVWYQENYTLYKDLDPTHLLFYAFLFKTVCVSPFVEEVVFRGLLQTEISKVFSEYPTIGLQALIFSLLHIDFSQGIGVLSVLCPVFCLALGFGWLYHHTKSLASTTLCHGLWNLLSVIGLLIENFS